jgi:hypothetical protein
VCIYTIFVVGHSRSQDIVAQSNVLINLKSEAKAPVAGAASSAAAAGAQP